MKTLKSLIILSVIVLSSVQTSKAWEQDKTKHVIAGTVITAATSALTFELTKNKRTAFLAGMAATIVAGAAKELIYDKAMGRGTPEFADFGATVMGMSVAVPIRLW